jgi:hypothetical protein
LPAALTPLICSLGLRLYHTSCFHEKALDKN